MNVFTASIEYYLCISTASNYIHMSLNVLVVYTSCIVDVRMMYA